MRRYPTIFRRPEPEEPKTPAPAKFPLRIRLDGMKLNWTFGSDAERQAFYLGFREGVEYELEALKQRGRVPKTSYADLGPLKEQQP